MANITIFKLIKLMAGNSKFILIRILLYCAGASKLEDLLITDNHQCQKIYDLSLIIFT